MCHNKLYLKNFESIFKLKSLDQLNLSYNKITTSIDYSISQLENIKKINLSSNNIYGVIPSSL